MTKLLALLLALLNLGVKTGEEIPSDDPPETPPVDDPPADDDAEPKSAADDEGDDLEGLLDAATPDDEPQEPKEPKRRSAEALRREEDERIADRAARRAIEATRPAPTQQVDQQWQNEEEQLRTVRSSGNQDEINRVEWAVNTNRTLRQSENKANMALFQARESEDKNDFREVAQTHPKRYKAYSSRVEQKHQELLKEGQYISRRTIMRYMIGEDIDSGKVRFKSKEPKQPLPDNVTRISRGRSPTLRGDVSAKGRQTEQQKREARLANIKL